MFSARWIEFLFSILRNESSFFRSSAFFPEIDMKIVTVSIRIFFGKSSVDGSPAVDKRLPQFTCSFAHYKFSILEYCLCKNYVKTYLFSTYIRSIAISLLNTMLSFCMIAINLNDAIACSINFSQIADNVYGFFLRAVLTKCGYPLFKRLSSFTLLGQVKCL